VNSRGKYYFKEELLRLRGEVDVALNDPISALSWFQEAIQCAREQGSLTLELSATLSLAKLLVQTNRTSEAREILAGICSKFTDGVRTSDLRSAYNLLSSTQS